MNRVKQNSSPYRSTHSKQPSPQGRHLKQLDRLCDNLMPKELVLNKKLDAERKRVRQLEAMSTLSQDKVRQLEQEVDTVRKSLLLQIEMYKQMLREQDEEKTRHVKSLQSAYNAEIQRLLGEQDQQAKLVQAQRDDLSRKCQHATNRCQELEKKMDADNNEKNKLARQLELSKENGKHLEDKISGYEQQLQNYAERSKSEVASLKDQLETIKANHRMEIDSMTRSQERELENTKRQYEADLSKLESKRDSDLALKSSELRDVQRILEHETRRLHDQLTQKDRELTMVQVDLKREQEAVEKLTRQIGESVKQNELLLAETRKRESQKQALATKNRELQNKFRGQHAKSQQALQELRTEFRKEQSSQGRELELLKLENTKLRKDAEDSASLLSKLRSESKQLQQQVASDTKKIKATADDLAEQNRNLRSEIRTLKAVLLESSVEMQKCREQFLRMDKEKQRVVQTARANQEEHFKLRAVLAERDLESRHNRSIHYTSVRSRH